MFSEAEIESVVYSALVSPSHIFPLSVYLTPRDPLSLPGVPGLGNATNTISVMSFAAWMKERKSWLSKPPQRHSEENTTRHMTDS